MIKTLVSQGWTKNEIIYEMQRVFGNDVLILPRSIDDERSFLGKTLPLITCAMLVGALFFKRNGSQSIKMVKAAKPGTKVKKSKLRDEKIVAATEGENVDDLKKKLRNQNRQ